MSLNVEARGLYLFYGSPSAAPDQLVCWYGREANLQTTNRIAINSSLMAIITPSQ